MSYQDLRSVRQVADANPAFSEASLRWMIFRAAENGFGEVIVKLGGRVFLDVRRLDEWIESNRLGNK